MDPAASHSCHLLQQLHEQRIQGLLCDCMLVVKGVCFKAHKNVLAAFSQYFRSLFQNSSSQKNDVFHLNIKNIGGIGQILDFMYTSHLELNNDNIQAMLDIAQCLQIQNVLNMCYSFLKLSTPADQVSSLPCSGISLQSTYPTYNNPVTNENLSTPLLLDGLTQERHSHAHGYKDNNTSSEAVKSTPVVSNIHDKEAQLKQLSQPYKLRDYYSKQFYKENACSHVDKAPEQNTVICTDHNATETQPWSLNNSESILPPTDSLPMESLPAFSHTFVSNQDQESTLLQFPSEMRLKKAVHLKKLNFLRSQKAAEEPPEPIIELQNTVEESVFSNEKELEGSDKTYLEKEGDGNIFNNEGQNVEEERAESPSALDEHGHASHKHCACNVCGKGFKHPSNLELHKRSHTGEKPFECSVCGKHFSQAGNLQTHLRRHSGEKPYICEICGKRFAVSGDVQRHIVIHTGEKPHLCDICGRGFSNVSNLKEHEKTHAADKLYTCDECGKSFNMHRKLIKHRIRHTGERPYSCLTCGKRFGGSGDLRRHVRTHTGEKPYTCETCNKSFSRSAVLRRHKNMHCKFVEDGQNTSDEFSKAVTPTELDKSQNSDTLTSDVSIALIPESSQSVGNARTEFEGRTAQSFSKLHTLVHQQELPAEEKLNMVREKVSKSNLSDTSQSYTFADVDVAVTEETLQSDISLIRSSLATLENNCNEPLGNRSASTLYRSSDGPFFSSMSLWGLAMKTLQNESEIDQ
ncbi:zinc finger and BTB domain-containing protein 49 [Bombina bombina]|uniref:zinc finger and BTB domain-containing protein 49 n=1 Tax=Bombina bombina TaxID=8345 RepID=UPI00235AFC45|nr:zinc finger and BTB domain-containing protein 49 [Bombina bombina]XP_053560120.1 zinc finger and BTB domain-containing protein 49 [Bombina bombina]